MNVLGYTLPFTKEDLSRIKDFYYGGYKKDETYYDNFFITYESFDENKKSLTLYLVFGEMIRKHTENLSQNERENVQANVFLAIAKNIGKIDIKYRGLAKYVKTIITSRIINERNISKRYNALVDENIIIDDLSEEYDFDRDYSVELPKNFSDFIKRHGELGKLVVDIYQNDVRTANGLYNRCIMVDPDADKQKLKEVCISMIREIKKGGK